MSSIVMPLQAKAVCLIITFIELFSCISSTNVHLTSEFNTTSGPLRGRTVHLPSNKTVLQFLGVPYATAERFESPTDVKWTDILEATNYAKPCPQPRTVYLGRVITPNETSEACQKLNVYVPVSKKGVKHAKRPRPVLIWLGGISYSFGDAAKTQDGSFIASEENIIIVTLNYRLGILGFLSTGGSNLKGNYGLEDQIKALKWIKKNIERFGGDPNHVTLLGQSGGAMSAGLLLTSPQALGLFGRVVLMSGSPLSISAMVDATDAVKRARRIGQALGCNDMADLKRCLKGKPVGDIISAQAEFHNTPITSPFGPVVDGDILPDFPSKMLKARRFSVSAVMIGVTQDDGGLFMSRQLPGVLESKTPSSKHFNIPTLAHILKTNKLTENGPPDAYKIIKYQYTNWDDTTSKDKTQQSMMDIYTDSAFRAPAIRLANILSEMGVPTYFYQVDQVFTNKDKVPGMPHWRGVAHSDEASFLLAGSAGKALGKTFVKMLSNFVKTGAPTPFNQSGIPTWPRYTATDGKYMSIQPSLEIRSNLMPRRMALWNDLLPSLTSGAGVQLQEVGEQATPTTPGGSDKRCPKDKTTKALIAVVSIMAIVIIIMLSIIVYQGRTLSKRTDEGGVRETLR